MSRFLTILLAAVLRSFVKEGPDNTLSPGPRQKLSSPRKESTSSLRKRTQHLENTKKRRPKKKIKTCSHGSTHFFYFRAAPPADIIHSFVTRCCTVNMICYASRNVENKPLGADLWATYDGIKP